MFRLRGTQKNIVTMHLQEAEGALFERLQLEGEFTKTRGQCPLQRYKPYKTYYKASTLKNTMYIKPRQVIAGLARARESAGQPRVGTWTPRKAGLCSGVVLSHALLPRSKLSCGSCMR